MKYTENELKFQNTKDQMIIKGNPTIPEQFVNAFIEEKRENQNKIPVQLSVQKCRWKCKCTEFLSLILSIEWDVKENPQESLTK